MWWQVFQLVFIILRQVKQDCHSPFLQCLKESLPVIHTLFKRFHPHPQLISTPSETIAILHIPFPYMSFLFLIHTYSYQNGFLYNFLLRLSTIFLLSIFFVIPFTLTQTALIRNIILSPHHTAVWRLNPVHSQSCLVPVSRAATGTILNKTFCKLHHHFFG